jgi:chaperonin cofactor prefoldin
MSGCHVPAVGECACQCHTTGIKTTYSVNPPYPCCMCEAMTYGVYKPIEQKSDVQHLLERINTIDKNIDDALAEHGQKQISDYKDLINMIANLSMRLNKMESSLREFEKQRVIPISKRVDALEEQQTKQEVRLCDLQDSWVNLMAERDTFANYMVDHEKRLYELEEGDY